MEEEKVIFNDGEYHIVKKHFFSDELITFFDNTSWGETGALYEHKDTRSRLEEIERPTLLEVRDKNDLVGCCVFVGRTTYTKGRSNLTNFVRYLVANPKYRGQGLMTKYAIHTMDSVRKDAQPGTLYVGTVEKFNKKSYNLVSAVNYEETATIRTMSFSRLVPKKDDRVKRISTHEEKDKIQDVLKLQHSDFALFHMENIFYKNDYYYIEKNGEIIAGVQIFPARWVIKKLPGISGKIAMSVLPHIPILNKVFNPKNFQFLALEGFIYQKNCLEDLHKLISHVLNIHQLKTALFWLDEKAPLCEALLKYGKLGMLQQLGAASDATIMISFTDMAEDAISDIKSRPLYQSGFDFI